MTKAHPDKYNVSNIRIKFANDKECERFIQRIVKLKIDAENMDNGVISKSDISFSQASYNTDCEIKTI